MNELKNFKEKKLAEFENKFTLREDNLELSTNATAYILKQFISDLIDEIEKDIISEYKEALIWCSGSEDFQIEGKARKGWEKICIPLINNLNS